MQVTHVPRALGGPGDARFQVAVDLMLGDQGFHQILGLFAQGPEMGGILLPHHLFQRFLVLTLTGAKLAAVAPRRPKAHPLRIQQHHRASCFSQMQRCGKPRIARPHNADIRPHPARQRGVMHPRRRGGGIPTLGIFAGAVVCVQKVQRHRVGLMGLSPPGV